MQGADGAGGSDDLDDFGDGGGGEFAQYSGGVVPDLLEYLFFCYVLNNIAAIYVGIVGEEGVVLRFD